MITINSTPPLIGFVGNRIPYKLTSDNYLSAAGTKASMTISVTGIDTTQMKYLHLAFSNLTLYFRLMTAPDASGEQLPAAVAGDTFSTWAEKLYNALITNFYLRYNYDIVLEAAGASSRNIVFTAKETGTDWSFTATSDFSNVTFTPVAGTDRALRDGFNVVAAIYDENEQPIAHEYKCVDEDGVVNFDLAEYLASEVDDIARFTWPQMQVYPYILHTSYVKKYKVSFCEYYDALTRPLIFDSLRRAITGGLSREMLLYLDEINKDYFASDVGKLKFLSWSPNSKMTGLKTPEKLFFLAQGSSSYTKMKLTIKVNYTDSTSRIVDYTGLITYSQNNVYEFLVGYNEMYLKGIDTSRVIHSYEVYLRNEMNEPISETKTFILDWENHEYERHFIFRNSFGTYDVMRCTGRVQRDFKYDRASGMTITEEDPTEFNAPGKQFDNNKTQIFTANTGFIDSKMKEFTDEFLLSGEIYEVVDDALYAVTITTEQAVMKKDIETLNSLSFAYQRAWTDKFHSSIDSADINEVSPLTCDNDRIKVDSTDYSCDQTYYTP